jgi:hypothetical protein
VLFQAAGGDFQALHDLLGWGRATGSTERKCPRVTRETRPAETISSGFNLKAHEKITIHPPASALREGENTLGFFVPRFPEKDDLYIHMY